MTRKDIVEAGAGCGKTTSLVRRYLEALGIDLDGRVKAKATHFRASQILALTFTDEAAQNMRLRVIAKLSEFGLHDLAKEVLESSQISTFHAYCLNFISPLLGKLGYNSDLLDAQNVRRLRTREILKFLPKYPHSEKLLTAFELQYLVQLVLDQWFIKSDSSPNFQSRAIESYLKKAKDAKSLIQEMRNEFPEEFEKDPSAWQVLIEKIISHPLEHSVSDKDFDFRKGTKKLKTGVFAELYEYAQSMKEFLSKNYHLALKSENFLNEKELQKNLHQFILSVRDNSQKYLDFAALEYECEELLRNLQSNSPPSDFILPSPPKLLLVDEFQDTSPSQFRILQALSQNQSELYFVGDPKQSIYAFRKADVRLFLQQRARMDLTLLDTNYRSLSPLLDFTNLVQQVIFPSNATSFDPPFQILKSGLAHASPSLPSQFLTLTRSPNKKELFHESLLCDLQEDLQIPDLKHGIGVLFRSWNRLKKFAEVLEKNQIPFQISGGKQYLNHLLSGVFSDFLEWYIDPTQAHLLISLHRWTRVKTESYELPSPEDLLQFSNKLKSSILAHSLFELYTRFFSEFQPHRFELGLEWSQAMEALILSSEERFGLDQSSLKDFSQILKNNSAEIEASHISDVSALKKDSQKHPLRLLTIHGSKGLEFDIVYLPELYEQKRTSTSQALESDGGELAAKLRLFDKDSGSPYPSILFKEFQLEKDQIQRAEQKRLFYVAVTRAISKMRIYYHLPKNEKKATSAAKSSYFENVLGESIEDNLFWNETLETVTQSEEFLKAHAQGNYSIHDLEVLPVEEMASEAPELWQSIPNINSLDSSVVISKMGVRTWLDQQFPDESKKWATFQVNQKKNVSAENAMELGKVLHSILERWNGNSRHLEELAKHYTPTQVQLTANLLQQVRELPALAPFFEALESADPRVMREVPIIVQLGDARLTGIIDAIFVKSEKEIQIIDWKTGSDLKSLAKKERLEKLSQQLSVYAHPYLAHGFKVTGTGVGIEVAISPDSKPAVEIIFNEDLKFLNLATIKKMHIEFNYKSNT